MNYAKTISIAFLMLNGGLCIPLDHKDYTKDKAEDENINQNTATASFLAASTKASYNLNDDTDMTTPTMYEIVEQDLEAEFDTTTVSPNATETTMPFKNPSPNQEEILNELHDLWYYSEALSDSQRELKSSISTIVHLAYARVQTEPEETLDRLKYMLQKLRARLFIREEDDSQINETPTTTAESTLQRSEYQVTDSNTNAKGNTDNMFIEDTTQFPETTTLIPNVPMDTSTTKPNAKTIRKRSVFAGEFEKVVFPINVDSAENSLFPDNTHAHSTNNINSEMNSNNVYNSNSNSAQQTPSAATIQKIIHVKDREPLPHKTISTSTSPTKLPQIQIHVLDLNSTSPVKTLSTAVPDTDTTTFPSLITLLSSISSPAVSNSQEEDEKEKNPVTVSQIADAIYLLLNPNMKNASSSTQNSIIRVKKPIFLHDNDMPPVNNNLDFNNSGETNKESEYGTTSSSYATTTLQPLPDYLNKFHLFNMQEKVSNIKPIVKNASMNSQEDSLNRIPTVVINPISTMNEVQETATNAVTVPIVGSVTITKPPQSAIMSILDEMTESLIVPATFLNGTKEGISQLFSTFNTISFTAKMILLFVLSISILSIALGIYSMGPPIIAVGVLGIIIPIALLIILQNNIGKKRNKGQQDGLIINTAMTQLANEEFNQIIDLIFDAINKYS